MQRLPTKFGSRGACRSACAALLVAAAFGCTLLDAISNSSGNTTCTLVGVTPTAATIVTVRTVSTSISAVLSAACNNSASIPILWASSNTAVATVGRGPGQTTMVVWVAPGTATISANNIFSAIVTVTQPVVAVAIETPTITVGQTTHATATVTDATGAVYTGASYRVTWQSSVTAVAHLLPAGDQEASIIGHSPGQSTITASIGGVSRSAVINVTTRPTAPVASVTVTGPLTVQVANTIQLSATLKDASGNVIAGPTITWQSGDPTRATVANGVVTGVSLGQVVITATAQNVSGSATVNVVPGPVASLVIAPPNASLQPTQTVQLTITARDAAGNVIGNPQVAWASANPAVATVTPSGSNPATATVTAVAPGGPVAITATVAPRSATSAITVIPTANARYAYALADNPTSASYAPAAATSYNSSGQPITIVRSGMGLYEVQFAGLQPAAGESQVVQVTTYGSEITVCKIADVVARASSLAATVNCYTMADTPIDQRFVILVLGSGALPGRFAFGWANLPTVTSAYAAAQAFNSTGQGVHVVRMQNGVYRVLFPGNNRPAGGLPEIALVTATGTGAARCTINSYVVSSSLDVHCVGDVTNYFIDDDAAFMAVLLESGLPGRRFGFATVDAMGALVSTESTAGGISVSRLGAGRVDVRFTGLGRTAANGTETVQVGVLNDTGAFCKVLSWQTAGSVLTVSVQCFAYGGTAADEAFRVLVMQ